MKTILSTAAMLMLLTSVASAYCPDYVMSCTAKGRAAMMGQTPPPPPKPIVRTTTCTTIRSGSSIRTVCTSN